MKFMNKEITTDDLKREKWLRYLMITNQNEFNIERVSSLTSVDSHQTLSYVEKTLEIASTYQNKQHKYWNLVLRTLQWSEVAKCGTDADRKRWKTYGVDLGIHNEASAEIYRRETDDKPWVMEVVYRLIRTHGLIGQYIRGEVDFLENYPILELAYRMHIPDNDLNWILLTLNEAIIKGVSDELWEKCKEEVCHCISFLTTKKSLNRGFGVSYRLTRLFPNVYTKDKVSNGEKKLFRNIFSLFDLWYAEAAMGELSQNEISEIFRQILKQDLRHIKHLSFYELSKTLSYDYEGKRKLNVYKKRIIEDWIQKGESPHVSLSFHREEQTLHVDIVFSKPIEKLIEFCIVAEQSGVLEYQKYVAPMMDLFGFRRDIFDRLNNETKYLETMNDTVGSKKLELLDYVPNTAKSIVDVGSGGGVLLKVLEEKFPEKEVIGTDISETVIEQLKKDHTVYHHNFVDSSMEPPVDCIIFSSILHEIFSYTELDGKKFNYDSLHLAFKNAYDSLNIGGRILIRDGVLNQKMINPTIEIKDTETLNLAKAYVNQFQGLPTERVHQTPLLEFTGENLIVGSINAIQELLYTVTWGSESFAHEVQEQFGYYTLEEYQKKLEEIGFHVLVAKEYFEEGYEEHLKEKVEFLNCDWKDFVSHCCIIAEKVK